MKRAITGSTAYLTIVNATLPERTRTYTPIHHSTIISGIRKEVEDAGYTIEEEKYSCSLNGQIALGTFRIKYLYDPDIVLSATFLNSYNKQYAFRFTLGAIIKETNDSFVLKNAQYNYYKKVHRGDADILSEGKIKDFIQDSGEYWKLLVSYKDMLKSVIMPEELFFQMMGDLYFNKGALSSLQLNIIKSSLGQVVVAEGKESEFYNGWLVFHHIVNALNESHPATWIDDTLAVTECFNDKLKYFLPPDEKLHDPTTLASE